METVDVTVVSWLSDRCRQLWWWLGEGEVTNSLSAPAGGFKRSGILHLDGASYIPLHLDFLRIVFYN